MDVRESFKNNDAVLLQRTQEAQASRAKAGLDGLVGGLEAVIINVEADALRPAVDELLRRTGLRFREAFENDEAVTCQLGQDGAVDFLVRVRKRGGEVFEVLNRHPKTAHLPHTRLETFVFKCRDLDAFHRIQTQRGVRFLTPEIVRSDRHDFIQTLPSPYTGNSLGFVQWKDEESAWKTRDCAPLSLAFEKPALPWLDKIFELDHTATRVRAEDRDDAIVEFIGLTGYRFAFAVYVEGLNSITNVARLSMDDYAQVFTSGIAPFTSLEESGPTEKFIHNYGQRVHHLAFRCEDIEDVYASLGRDGLEFMVELVGGREEGLHQTFTWPSPHTFLVNEYIQRYDGFDGFFTKSNVTLLTKSTEKQ